MPGHARGLRDAERGHDRRWRRRARAGDHAGGAGGGGRPRRVADDDAIEGALTFTDQIAVASDKTLVGMGSGAELLGGGLNLTDSHNAIVRNLTIARAAGTDAVTLLRSRNVWIDHCDLSSETDAEDGAYDGLIDITHATDAVTVSWTRLHDHRDATLVGHAVDNGDEDRGHLTVTYHHNLFRRTSGAAPRVRFGTAHVFNNHYADIAGYAVAATMGAIVRVERSVFENVTLPFTTLYVDPEPGLVADVENVFTASIDPPLGVQTAWMAPYAYTADAASSVPALVAACAGPGRL